MQRLSLFISAVLSLVVAVLNFTDHRYVYGIFMAIIFVSVLIAFIGEVRRTKG